VTRIHGSIVYNTEGIWCGLICEGVVEVTFSLDNINFDVVQLVKEVCEILTG